MKPGHRLDVRKRVRGLRPMKHWGKAKCSGKRWNVDWRKAGQPVQEDFDKSMERTPSTGGRVWFEGYIDETNPRKMLITEKWVMIPECSPIKREPQTKGEPI